MTAAALALAAAVLFAGPAARWRVGLSAVTVMLLTLAGQFSWRAAFDTLHSAKDAA